MFEIFSSLSLCEIVIFHLMVRFDVTSIGIWTKFLIWFLLINTGSTLLSNFCLLIHSCDSSPSPTRVLSKIKKKIWLFVGFFSYAQNLGLDCFGYLCSQSKSANLDQNQSNQKTMTFICYFNSRISMTKGVGVNQRWLTCHMIGSHRIKYQKNSLSHEVQLLYKQKSRLLCLNYFLLTGLKDCTVALIGHHSGIPPETHHEH